MEEVRLHVAPHVGEPPEFLHIGQQEVITFVLSISTCGMTLAVTTEHRELCEQLGQGESQPLLVAR